MKIMEEKDSHIKLYAEGITGGKITKDQISELEESDATELSISGLRQDTFEYLIFKYGSKFRKINFWKCPRVEDLTPLETLKNIEGVDWFWNTKSKSLWDFSKNIRLTFLHLRDFQNVQTISEISKSNSLIEIDIDGGIWKQSEIDSLETLTQISTLKTLNFSSKLADRRAEPIIRMKNLEELYFSSNVFTTEQIAWLTSKIVPKVKSPLLAPYRNLEDSAYRNNKGEYIDTLVIGKRKPFLDSEKHSDRLQKYILKFQELVTFYKDNPDAGEPI